MPVKKGSGKMVVVSVHMPEKWVNMLEELVREGYFPTIREAIRYGVFELLMRITATKSCGNKEATNVATTNTIEGEEEMEILRGRI
jgi:Arc/MetJ-type ribon-helix-helix transcriptional regulator